MSLVRVGVEGALEGMTTGRVDENWAKQHHSLWYEEARKEGTQVSDAGEPAGGATRGEPA